MKKSLLALAVLAATGAAALTGCSGGIVVADKTSTAPSAKSTQTVAEACAVTQDTMKDIQADFSESMSGLGSGDVSGAVDVMTTLSDKLDEAEGKITNADVKAAVSDLGDKFGEFGDLLAKAKDGGMQALAGDADKLQSLSTGIQDAAKKMSDLCS